MSNAINQLCHKLKALSRHRRLDLARGVLLLVVICVLGRGRAVDIILCLCAVGLAIYIYDPTTIELFVQSHISSPEKLTPAPDKAWIPEAKPTQVPAYTNADQTESKQHDRSEMMGKILATETEPELVVPTSFLKTSGDVVVNDRDTFAKWCYRTPKN